MIPTADAAVALHWLQGASAGTIRTYDYLRAAQLIAHRHKRLWVTPRLKTIAADLAISIRTARRAIKWLAARGLIDVQHRFARLKNGLLRQISNRIRVAVSTTAALSMRLALDLRAKRVAASAAALAKHRPYSPDTDGRAGTKKDNNSPYRQSPLYRQLMLSGLNPRR